MEATQRRLLQGLGVAALAVGGLTAGACIHPPAPVHEISVQRTDERARTGKSWFAGEAVVYRLGVHTEQVEQLRDDKGRVRFKVFRCPSDDREIEVPATVEPAEPGAAVTWIRVLVPRRHVEVEARHCGHFWGTYGFMVMGGDQPASSSFRFEPAVAGAGPPQGDP